MRSLRFLGPALTIALLGTLVSAQAATAALNSADYPPAVWKPANANNFSVADRPHDYPVDMIVIHDIEGTDQSAIAAFQNPSRAASAHYVIGYNGTVTQMVREKDIAWHAGNWDYNTRAIGIEHAGYAAQNLYTAAEYQASNKLIASICSRWGVTIDRTHIIGHYQVPDPNHPGLFGGSDHHWDPGPHWNWDTTIYGSRAIAATLPSPPHMVLKATAVGHDKSVTLSWPAARSCRTPIDHYDIVEQPDNVTTAVPGTATSLTIGGLTNGKTYLFTVTAVNTYGQDTVLSNYVVPATVPDAPTNVTAGGFGGSAVVRWITPSFNGGATIIAYVVTPYLNGVTPQSSTRFDRPTTFGVILNLTNGANYTFKVRAINVAGPSLFSIASNSVTPSASFLQPPAQAPPVSPSPRSGPNPSTPVPSPPAR